MSGYWAADKEEALKLALELIPEGSSVTMGGAMSAHEIGLVEALKKANIWEFVEQQETGLETMVGNRGLKLSGGEKQRLSIARVLLKDPTVFIFDEATSALDSISEQRIQEAIDPIIQSRTSILIAHRLSTILAADEILVVKEGRIVERGQHKDLVAQGGVYRELYETQFSKALMPEEDGVSELEQYVWGQQPADEPMEE